MGQITSLFARKMVAAVARDIDVKQALAMVGLDPDAPWNPREMISSDAYYDMLEGMAEQIDITALPVKVGASMRCDEYGALGLAWKAAPNLLGSFTRVQRYARLWTSVVSYELTEVPEGMLYLVRREAPRRLGVRLSNETTLVATVALSRQVSPVFLRRKRSLSSTRRPNRGSLTKIILNALWSSEPSMMAYCYPKAHLNKPTNLGTWGYHNTWSRISTRTLRTCKTKAPW